MTTMNTGKNTTKGNRLLWIVACVFVVQILAWSVFLHFARKSQPAEVPLSHRPPAP